MRGEGGAKVWENGREIIGGGEEREVSRTMAIVVNRSANASHKVSTCTNLDISMTRAHAREWGCVCACVRACMRACVCRQREYLVTCMLNKIRHAR